MYNVYVPSGDFERVTIGGCNLIVFGFTGALGSLLLDLSSGCVMEKVEGDSSLSLVNTSLDSFNRCLAAFSAKFPLAEIEDADEAEERDNRVAREVEEEICRIDRQVYAESSFWYEVRWSVAIGNFRD
ncbi:SUKH-4 family immunity protein [Streptomyces sp. NPDC051677]|uniref:SUKH-4 family immunity protein n=1 Tax=Streptomyces sp. NPDC051677 TaxID=3365669 RepID=UPI0037D1EC3A